MHCLHVTSLTFLSLCCRYVIQRYITNPLLWKSKFKFHFRIYVVLTANMQFHVYRQAFAHVANKPFTMTPTTCPLASNTPSNISTEEISHRGKFSGKFSWDPEIHLTNVAANIHDRQRFHAFPIVELPKEFPNFWVKIRKLFASMVS